MPASVWVEGHVGTFLLDKPAELLRYEELFVSIARLSLTASASRAILRQAADGWRADGDSK
jgi:hypothetical protein